MKRDEVTEYDNYVIPPYDDTMSSEERELAKEVARRKFKEFLQELKKKYGVSKDSSI